MPRGPSSADELLKARDAYSGATALALINVGVQVLGIAGGVSLPRVLPLGIILCDGSVSLMIAAYLLATRARPDRGIAIAVGCLYLAFFVVLNAFVAARSVFVGRPFDAYPAPELLLATFGLVVPSIRLGVIALAVFFAEGIGIYLWQRSGVTSPALIPVNQPGALVAFAILGASLLYLRYRRRELALRYLRSGAELGAVRRLSQAFDSVAVDLDRQLEIIAHGLSQAARPSVALQRTRRAIGRLAHLRQQLSELTGAPPGGAEPAGASEREFYARDAQNGATILALMGAMMSVAAWATMRGVFPTATLWCIAAIGLLGVGCLCLLVATRHRPTERRGIAVSLAVILPYAAMPFLTQPEMIASFRAFEPLIAQKMIALLLPLAVGRRLWLGLVLEAALVAQSAYLYYGLGLSSVTDSISTFEPWFTLAFPLIGTGILLVSEHRRVASVQAMRADRELTTQARRAGLQLALLDQLGSPLQTLALGLDTLRVTGGNGEQTHAMTQAVRVLSGLRDRIPAPDAKTAALVGASFDGAAELRRSG
jgi:hypothetical protein